MIIESMKNQNGDVSCGVLGGVSEVLFPCHACGIYTFHSDHAAFIHTTSDLKIVRGGHYNSCQNFTTSKQTAKNTKVKDNDEPV